MSRPILFEPLYKIRTFFEGGTVPGRSNGSSRPTLGARVFGIGGDSFDPGLLPRPFSHLAPSEIEDCLCIDKDELRGQRSSSP